MYEIADTATHDLFARLQLIFSTGSLRPGF